MTAFMPDNRYSTYASFKIHDANRNATDYKRQDQCRHLQADGISLNRLLSLKSQKVLCRSMDSNSGGLNDST